MRKSQKTIEIQIQEPAGGYDLQRLSAALRVLISREDLVTFFSSRSNRCRPIPLTGDDDEDSARPRNPQVSQQASSPINHF